MGHINIRSIVNKSEQIEHLLIDSNIDILGISESWLTPKSPTAAVNVQGYNTFRRDRETGKGGGVLANVKSHLKCELISWPQEVNIECIGLNVTLSSSMSFTVICMYRPPSAKDIFYNQLETVLNCCNAQREIILMGDLNVNWDSKPERRKLKQLTDKNNLIQTINGPTRITNKSKTTIDLLFTNKPERIERLLITCQASLITILFSAQEKSKGSFQPQATKIDHIALFLKICSNM